MKIITKTSLASVAGIASIFLAVAFNSASSTGHQQAQPPKKAVQSPMVSVIQATPISHQATVTAYGEVKSSNQLTLTSQVSGKVTYLSPTFLTGNSVKKGQLLAQIEPIVYEQALANAQVSLANAKLALAQEKLNSEQAAQEWQQSGLAAEQASDLVLRKPQLAAAKAEFSLASIQVAKAKYDLSQTKIRAPFDALVVSKAVQMGSNLQVGSQIAQLYAIALFEVALPLSPQQWQLLPNSLEQLPNSLERLANIEVLLTDQTSTNQWVATVNRFEQHINSSSRQRSLIVTIKRPLSLDTPLYPGTFVKATIKGLAISQLWQLPTSALIDSNSVWQVDNDGLLNQLAVNVIFSQGNHVYVKPQQPLTQASIVKRPLASYLTNMKVQANNEQRSQQMSQLGAKETQSTQSAQVTKSSADVAQELL